MSEPTFREKRGHASWRKVDATGTSRFSQQFKGVQTDASKLFKIIQDREQPSQKRVSALVSWIGPGRDARARIEGNVVVTNLLQNLIGKIRTLRTLRWHIHKTLSFYLQYPLDTVNILEFIFLDHFDLFVYATLRDRRWSSFIVTSISLYTVRHLKWENPIIGSLDTAQFPCKSWFVRLST
jgi:hypothetical protein